MTTTEPMMTGFTDCPADGDPAALGHFRATDAVEPALGGAAAGSVAPDPSLGSNVDGQADQAAGSANVDSWRVEVAARLERYRTRRKPRTPRYPSLLLPFDMPESWSRPAPPKGSVAVAVASPLSGQDFAFDGTEEPPAVDALFLAELREGLESRGSGQSPHRYPEAEQSANVIEFPRSAAIPVFRANELADPIFDRPRIVEVPEILPPPPALGGMLIEPTHQETADQRTGNDVPLASASIARRALAVLVDGVVLAMTLVACGAIFLRLNPVRGPLPLPAGALVAVAILLWAAYEFMFIVYTGSTPGLRAAGLRLAGFDGSPLSRGARRWRVLASFLSAFSAGLGYVWCTLDQDGLCWHDRITRTHVQMVAREE